MNFNSSVIRPSPIRTTITSRVCYHRRYRDVLANFIKSGIDTTFVLTLRFKLSGIKEAYRMFDREKDKSILKEK